MARAQMLCATGTATSSTRRAASPCEPVFAVPDKRSNIRLMWRKSLSNLLLETRFGPGASTVAVARIRYACAPPFTKPDDVGAREPLSTVTHIETELLASPWSGKLDE